MDGELIASHTGQKCTLGQQGLHSPRNRYEHGVTGTVAQCVVDLFEIVEIEIADDRVFPDPAVGIADAVDERSPIRQSGKGVFAR